jgi:predicted phage terminase large subunit-like protein
MSSEIDQTLDLETLRARARESFYFFAKGILKFDWLTPHVHGPVCELLQNSNYKRKLFVLPRGWLKTTLCSISYPIWRAVHNPNIRIMIAQNNHQNAKGKLRVIREHFERNVLLRTLYPDVLPSRNSTWTSDSLCLTRSGSYPESTFECIGVRGQPTSRHYDIIIEDDTVAPDFDELGEETLAPTHDDVNKAVNWHKLALPLLTDSKKGEILIVGTRWYERDLISHIIQNEPDFKLITRSCRENEQGESDPRGKVTYPERFDEDVLTQWEATLGPYFFSTLMLNLPVSVGDMVFKPEWFKEYEILPPPRSLAIYTTIDAATDPQLSMGRPDQLDYSTVMTCGKDLVTGDIYCLEYFRSRCSPGEHAAALFDQVTRWKPTEVGYEDVAYQRSIEYWLKELMKQRGEYFILKPIKRTGRQSKETHIMGLHPIVAAGALYLRPHMKELLTEFLAFPRGRHDDLIDTMAMQTQLWKRTKTNQEAAYEAYASPYDVSNMIKSIQIRKRSLDRDSIIFEPARKASFFFAN